MLYMFLESGFEETEALASLDMIRRGQLLIQTVSTSKTVTGSHGITVMPDLLIQEASTEKMTGIILPGGQPGTENLKKNPKVQEFLSHAYENKLLIGAICAAPSILGELGYLTGKKATAYPGYEEKLLGAELSNGKVVVDGNIITAKAMGASIEFGASVIAYFNGEAAAKSVLESIYAG